MTSPKSPAFQFYAHDFLAGRVATYNLDEIGAYSLLLAFDWTLNGLPTEPEKLAKLCRISARKFAVIWQTIGEQFPERDGRRYNPRLELERRKQAENREKKQRAALSRWSADADADASIVHSENECPPSPTPSPSPRTTKRSSAPASPDEQRVLDHYASRHPLRKLTPSSLKIVRKALALGYSATDLCEAIDGNADDEWHSKKHKHELSYVLRNADLIDGFRANAMPVGPIVDKFGVLTAYGQRLTDPSHA